MSCNTLQETLSCLEAQLENYGSLTSILTHVIQHVGITPIVKDPELRQMLTELHSDGISIGFSCLFLHNLNLINRHLPQLPKDSTSLLKHMKVKVDQKWKETPPVPELPLSEDSISWDSLQVLLYRKDKSTNTVRKWTWDPLWSLSSITKNIFCEFMSNYWHCLTAVLFQPLPGIANLKGAMRCWSLESVEQRIPCESKILLIPSIDTLEGYCPPNSKTYSHKRRTAFFPELEPKPTHHTWKV